MASSILSNDSDTPTSDSDLDTPTSELSLESSLSDIRNQFAASETALAINTLLGWHVGKRDELRILQILTDAEDLNALLPKIRVKVLFRSFRNHSVRNAPNKTNLYRLFGTIRISELTVSSKVTIISAICRKSKPDTEDQKFILELFYATKGHALHELKHRLDHYSHYSCLTDIYDRVFNDESLRLALELYIQYEAAELKRDPTFKADVHVLSDIDDTFVNLYGLGGPKYPKGSVLPGVLTLFTSIKAHVVFITARPRSARGLTFRQLKRLSGVKNLSVLTGKLRDSVLIPFHPDVANEMIADRKINNFQKHKRMFPECLFIWFGDSGQSDAEVGVRLMREESVLGAYIQDVARKDGVILATTCKEREEYLRKGVQIVDNYVDVAVRMYEQKLLTEEGLRDTALDAVVQLTFLRPQFEDPNVYEARAHELQSHLADVNAILVKASMTPVQMGYTLPTSPPSQPITSPKLARKADP